jgi:ubiquinone biosynthesis protein
MQAAVQEFLRSYPTTAARTRAVEAALRTPAGRFLREEMARWVVEVLPAGQVVPEVYAAWRPLVTDAMIFMVTHLSAPRLAPKLIEQLELPPRTTPEERLLRLISKVPGLQKIGQVLARNRHLHPALRRALSQLENGISDVDAAGIRARIGEELGALLDTYAVEIAPEIFCEASVSAVVRFTWLNPATGRRERGVFKVLKPYVPACFKEDMALLRQLSAFLAERHPEYGRPLPETITNVQHLLEREVDYPREQATLLEAARVYARRAGVRIPQLIRPLSTAKITALSEETGVKVTAAFRRDPAARRKVAEQLLTALVAAPLFSARREAIFHADPHAGNLLYDEAAGELVVLDWALTERLTRPQRRHIAILALMIALRDAAGVCAEIQALSLDDLRRHPAQSRLVREIAAGFIDQLPVWRLPGSLDAMRLLDRLALEGVRFPPPLLMFRKVLFTLDGILHELGEPVNPDWIIARHLATGWMGTLHLVDWAAVEASALLLAPRLWVQWAQAALAKA